MVLVSVSQVPKCNVGSRWWGGEMEEEGAAMAAMAYGDPALVSLTDSQGSIHTASSVSRVPRPPRTHWQQLHGQSLAPDSQTLSPSLSRHLFLKHSPAPEKDWQTPPSVWHVPWVTAVVPGPYSLLRCSRNPSSPVASSQASLLMILFPA